MRLPKHILYWDDCRGDAFGDNGILVTLKGYAWTACKDKSGHGDHVRGFDTPREARELSARKYLHVCDCPECVN